MKVVNLTPHEVVVMSDNREVVDRYPATGQIARVSEVIEPDNLDLGGVPVVRKRHAEVVGLPEPQDEVLYLVSVIVPPAVPDRNDLIVPDTGPDSAVRDDGGRIIGVRRLARMS